MQALQRVRHKAGRGGFGNVWEFESFNSNSASNLSDINVVMFKFQNWMVGNILGHTNIDAHNCDFR